MNDINDVAKRMKEQREKENLSFQDLANKTGLSKSTLQRYETGGIKNIPLDKLQILANGLNCSQEYLLGWDDEPSGFNIFSIPGIEPLPEMVRVPLLGTIACGEPILADENIEEYIPVAKYVDADFCLRCKGDSMINARIHDGDIVCIKQQPMVENGEIAAVLIEEEATLKRFYQYGDMVVLRAENPTYKDMEYHQEEFKSIRIIGKATHFISKIK